MPNSISGKLLKKKALDRWENEGGKFFEDQAVEGFSHKRKINKQSEATVLRSDSARSEFISLPRHRSE